MRTKYSRIAAALMAITAGGLAAFALRPTPGHSAGTVAARNPAVEVRTQVIRRTIHVIRHEPGARLRGSHGFSAVLAPGSAPGHARARTAASGRHGSTHTAGTATAAAVATRASGSHGASPGAAPARSSGHPVSTRSSGSHGTAPAPTAAASHPVTTRSSGSHGASPGAAPAGSSGRPVTRASGGGHGHGGDGRDDGGHDD